ESMWGLYARISTRSGAAIEGMRHSTSPGQDEASAKKEVQPPGPLPVAAVAKAVDPASAESAGESSGDSAPRSEKYGLRARLEAKARGKDSRAAKAKLALAEFYRWVRPFDADDERDIEVAREADAQLESLESAYALAALARDQGEARDALDLAIRRARAAKGTPSALLGEL